MTQAYESASNFDLRPFGECLARTRQRLLLLDYDGTLAPFRTDASKATPYAAIPELVDAIMDEGSTRVVIITGRWTRDLIPLLGLKRRPEIWGTHGRERLMTDGRYELFTLSTEALQALLAADAWETAVQHLGGWAERKPASLAFHWRGLSTTRIARIRAYLLDCWTRLGVQHVLDLQHFDGGMELTPLGRTKGDAVAQLLSETGPEAAVAYLGDDRTDEDAFTALQNRGLSVLVRDVFRNTGADLWLRPPHELRAFLGWWLQVCISTRQIIPH